MAPSATTFISAAAADAIVREFDALGTHRTGSPGDDATTDLLIRRLSEMGVQGAPFPIWALFRPELAAMEARTGFQADRWILVRLACQASRPRTVHAASNETATKL